MTNNPTREQIVAALKALKALADAIRDFGRIPSGHLYAQVMGHMSLETYNSMIARLKGASLVVEEKNHELIWIGPTFDGNGLKEVPKMKIRGYND